MIQAATKRSATRRPIAARMTIVAGSSSSMASEAEGRDCGGGRGELQEDGGNETAHGRERVGHMRASFRVHWLGPGGSGERARSGGGDDLVAVELRPLEIGSGGDSGGGRREVDEVDRALRLLAADEDGEGTGRRMSSPFPMNTVEEMFPVTASTQYFADGARVESPAATL